MALASIRGGPYDFTFRTNPSRISWSHELKTNVENTYGGRVVQILGASIGGLTVGAEGGMGRDGYLREVLKFALALTKWQKVNEKPVTFYYPPENFVFDVFLQGFTFNDEVNNVVFPYSFNFLVQEDVSGVALSKTITEEFKGLKSGIGFNRESAYTNPESPLNKVDPLTESEGGWTQGGSSEGGSSEGVPSGQAPPASALGAAIAKAGEKYLGTKYVWGGGGKNGPSNGGFDCSGFTQYCVYQGSGGKITIPRTAHTQQSAGASITKDQLAPGDLVMFTKKGTSRAHHVVVYHGNGRVIHAPRTGSVVKYQDISAWNGENWTCRRMTY